MIDFEIMERAFKIAWNKRIAKSGDASWKTILNYAVRQFGGIDFLINCDFDVKSLNLEQLTDFCGVSDISVVSNVSTLGNVSTV